MAHRHRERCSFRHRRSSFDAARAFFGFAFLARCARELRWLSVLRAR